MILNDAVAGRATLEKLAGMEMDTVSALQFAGFVRKIMIEIQSFEMRRAELFRKYGEEMEEGEEKGLQIKPENEEEFNDAIRIALNKDIEVDPFDLANLGIAIAPTDLINALSLFK